MLKYNGNNIKKVYKNKDIVKKIYKNSNVVFEYQNTLLPQGYQECKYIQTTGTQYIKTDFKPSDYSGNYTVMLDFQGVELLTETSYMCGCGSPRSCNVRVATSGGLVIYNNNMSNSGAATTVSMTYVETDILNRNKYKITLKNEDITTLITKGQTYSEEVVSKTASTSNFVIGRSSGTNFPIKIYGCKLYNGNGDLVRNFVPCLDDNNVPCMYEYVTQQTFYNTGTGTFTYEVL